MIPVKLRLSNFTSYGEVAPELDLTKLQLAAISGPNGVGKSSLLDAITWCLWGTSRAGDSSDQLVRLGSTLMWVEFSFELDNHTYMVKRSRKLNSSTSLEFSSGQLNLTEGTIKATQEKIIQTLHLTFETFVNSAYIRQGHADEFTTKGPTERKQILADILGLSQYDELEEKAKEKIKGIEANLKLIEYQLLELEAELTAQENHQQQQTQVSIKVAEIEKEVSNLEIKLKSLRLQKEGLTTTQLQSSKLRSNLDEARLELAKILDQGRLRKHRIEQLTQEIKDLAEVDRKISELNSRQQELEEATQKKQQQLKLAHQISELSGQIQLQKQQQDQIMDELSMTKQHLKDLGRTGAICATCKQPLDKLHRQESKKTFEQKIDELTKKLTQINFQDQEKQLKDLTESLTKVTINDDKFIKLKEEVASLQLYQAQKETLIQKQATLDSEQKTRAELLGLFKDKNAQVSKLEEEVSKTPDKSREIIEANQLLDQTETQLNQLRQEERSQQSALGEIKQLISRGQQLVKTKKNREEEKATLEHQREIYQELSLAFGKKGIPAMIIETSIPEIEVETNLLLDKLTEGRMRVALPTQRETKSGEGVIETLDIIISDEMGDRPYENYSGGEQFRVNLALRLALSKLLTHRAGAKLQFLIIDEGFGTQDAEGIGRIVTALNTIKDDFAKILIITHLDELKEEFDVRVEVSKGPEGSTFTLAGL